MFPFGKPPVLRQDWLADFARRLAWAFPEPQAKEILADYQAQFASGQEHGKSDGELTSAAGTPAEAVAQLLEEDPAVRKEQLRHTLLWGALLAVCWAFLWVCFSGMSEILLWGGSCAFLPMASAVLFLLVRGPARVALEAQLRPEKRKIPLPVFLVPAVLMLVCIAAEEILVLVVVRLGLRPAGNASSVGTGNTWFLMIFMWITGFLAVGFLALSVLRSVRYFPGVIQSVGAMGSALFLMVYFTGRNVDASLALELGLLLRAVPYIVSLMTALVFQMWIDGRRPMPQCFQTKAAAWTDWRHRLGVSLLGWFPPEQAAEVLEDFQEQFELGCERGKSEAEVISEFGRPDSVTRELLKEDRKARLRRKKTWLWAVLLAFSGWCLFRLMLGYTYGTIFVHVWNPNTEAAASLLLGAGSLFMLLHGWGRAMLERRFPCEKKPTVWVFLLPLLASAMVIAWEFFALAHVSGEVLGRPVGWILADLIEFSALGIILLGVWALARSFSGSIAYFPAVVHAAGCVAGMFSSGIIFSGVDVGYLSYAESPYSAEILWALFPVPYLLGAVLAIAFWAVLREAGKRG